MERLNAILRRIDGRGYPAYKDIKGTYHHDRFELDIVHVQGDPFAAPSKIAIRLSNKLLKLDPKDIDHPSRRVGLEDAILRSWNQTLQRAGRSRGSGKSGEWNVLRSGQEMVPRTACEIDTHEVTLRFTLGLPAAGRRILAREAAALFFDDLPQFIERGLLRANQETWTAHAKAAEDQDILRTKIGELGFVGFIANGSILPRASGASDKPLKQDPIPWTSPPELETEIELPNAGKIQGSAIKKGITLISGGGYHGKSTILQALARGVYNHVPGDGREFCVTIYETVAVRAEDGRAIENVDISGFISNLPNKTDTTQFSSENASGSTSQAANIMEAIELGACCLLMDEDTCATNFMMRDRRMQELVATDREPITPFIDRVRQLYEQAGVSLILIIGGAGDYFDIADEVLIMDAYHPHIATEKAKAISERFPSDRLKEERPTFSFSLNRIPLPESFDPRRGKRAERVRSQQTKAITFGHDEIDISSVAQLVDDGQTRTIGDWLIQLSRGLADGKRTMLEVCQTVEEEARTQRLSDTLPGRDGDRVFARRFELAAAINRLRTLQIDRE